MAHSHHDFVGPIIRHNGADALIIESTPTPARVQLSTPTATAFARRITEQLRGSVTLPAGQVHRFPDDLSLLEQDEVVRHFSLRDDVIVTRTLLGLTISGHE